MTDVGIDVSSDSTQFGASPRKSLFTSHFIVSWFDIYTPLTLAATKVFAFLKGYYRHRYQSDHTKT